MERIIIHWTAGTYKPNDIDKEHYHYLIGKNGELIKGNHPVADNKDCKDGKYAAHCGGGNTGSIGVAMCCMLGYVSKSHIGDYPMTQKQFETCMKLCAELCKGYNIPIDADHVMTHYEFGIKHPNTSSVGKIDITFIPPYSWVVKQEVGSFIRSKIKWYFNK